MINKRHYYVKFLFYIAIKILTLEFRSAPNGRKFRSQTAEVTTDDKQRWEEAEKKVRKEKVREEKKKKRPTKRKSEESRKKEDASARNGRN